MDWALFEQLPLFYYTAAALVGLAVGSFLNVVIARIPKMLEHAWHAECRLLLDRTASEDTAPNLLRPASHCPSCGAGIRALDNIPLLSYLLLRGRCRQCNTPIPSRYPLVETAGGLSAVAVAWAVGPSWEALAIAGFVWTLLALAVIDLEHQLLPDNLTQPLLWAGLALSLTWDRLDPATALIGAIAGYLALWLPYWGFKLTTGKEGMGYGDFKLLAAIGAWLGWTMLPLTILVSAIAGAVVGGFLILVRGQERSQPIPFGPWLVIGALTALFAGETINQFYLQAVMG